MDFLPESVSRLIEELSRLPGIGSKSAQRLAFHILKGGDSQVSDLGEAVLDIKKGVLRCDTCFGLTSETPCRICSNGHRDRNLLCVVESTQDLVAIEKTGEFKGLYHVLEGKISPLDGIGPDDLRIRELLERLAGVDEAGKSDAGGFEEVILALNPDLEGDITALFLRKKLLVLEQGGQRPIRITRIARGIPSGGNLEYTDETTLIRALQGRQLLA